LSDKVWVIDYTTTINTPLDSGILFEAYRYGGALVFAQPKNGQKTIHLYLLRMEKHESMPMVQWLVGVLLKVNLRLNRADPEFCF